jgi:hypothetical protein
LPFAGDHAIAQLFGRDKIQLPRVEEKEGESRLFSAEFLK